MGKLTKSMAIFNSYVKLPEGTILETHWDVAIFLYVWDAQIWSNEDAYKCTALSMQTISW